VVIPGTRDQFRTVREYLRDRYNEEIVAAALGVASVRQFGDRPDGTPIRDPLVKLFFGGAAVLIGDLRPVLPADVAESMSRMGLLRTEGDRAWSPVMIYPTRGIHLISDRFTGVDGSPAGNDREFVYFALTPNTQAYLDTLPDDRCGSFLDIGGGCGAGALLQARVTGTSWSTDISERCTLYAEFNRLLNNIENVRIEQGSLYEPAAERTFDRIGCHPPYDMTQGTPWVFADGGADGEFVIRGAVAGLPRYLNEGGEFIALFRAADCAGKPLEIRVREWLGDAHDAFDLALVERDSSTAQEHAFASAMSAGGDASVYRACMEQYTRMQVERLVYCSLLIRRKQVAAPPLTLRRRMGKTVESAELRWLLAWERAAPELDISAATFRVSPDIEVVVKHRARYGRLQPANYRLVSLSPFSDEAECPQWVALLISEFDGQKTASEIFEQMRRNGPIERHQFSAAVKRLLSLGVLQPASGSSITSSS
jgi:hypothetical protein